MSETLFQLYVNNWNIVRHHPQVQTQIDKDDIFLCPLCRTAFTREDLAEKLITAEHVPPEKLGGKVRTLTCKLCNNSGGTKLDAPLKKDLDSMDFFLEVPDSSLEIKYHMNDIGELPGTLHCSNVREWKLIGDPKRSKPHIMESLRNSLQNVTSEETSFTMSIRVPNPKIVNAALLRTAYLWAFSFFGYAFLVNHNLEPILSQIKNPLEETIPNFGIMRSSFSDELLGVNVITEPQEFQGFLVVFDLVSSLGTKTRYGVVLPSPFDPGLAVYQNLSDSNGKSMSFRYYHFPDEACFTKNPLALLHFVYGNSS